MGNKSRMCKPRGFAVVDNTTGKYPDCEKIALTEEWAKHLVYCDIDGFALTQDGRLVLMDECGNVAHCPTDRFGIMWEEEKNDSYCEIH